MTRRSSALLLAMALTTIPASAATTKQLSVKDDAPAADKTPAVEPSSAPLAQGEETGNDSPLVRAAKRANAARKTQKSVAVIGDKDVKKATGGHFTTTDTQVPLPGTTATAPKNPTIDNGPAEAEKAANAKKVGQLKNEQSRMAEETDQPYGGDVSEDQATARMSQIPGEINKAGGTPTAAPAPASPSNTVPGPPAPPAPVAPPAAPKPPL